MRLSIVLTNYNDSAYLRNAVKAICAQSYAPHEVIIVDDGSTDNSVEIIRELAEQYDCVRLVANDVNRGIQYSVRRGVSETSGDVIYAASCNDRIFPGHFEIGMRLLSQYPDAALFFADSIVDDRISGIRSENRLKLLPEPGYLSPEDLARKLRGGVIQTNTVLARRDKLIGTDVYPQTLRWHGDWWTFSLLAFRHGACYAPQILAESVVESGGYSSGAYVREQQRLVFREVLKRAAREADLLPLMKAARLFNYFLYVTDVVEIPLLSDFLKEEGFSQTAIALSVHLMAQKWEYRLLLLRRLAYKTYFHAFHYYLKKKIALRIRLGAGQKNTP